MTAEGGPVFAVRVYQEHAVAAVGLITPAARTCIKLDLPIPVVAKMPTWVARLAPGIPTLKSTTVSPLLSQPTGRSPMRSARKAKSSDVGATTAENWLGRLFGLRNTDRSPPVRLGRRQVAEAAALRDPIGPALLLVQGVHPGFTPFVIGEKSPGHPLGPTWLAVLGPIGHVDHPEQVAPIRGGVDGHEELADEQILIWGGPKGAFQHVASVEAASGRGGTTARDRGGLSSVHHPVPVCEGPFTHLEGTCLESNTSSI